MRPLALPGHHGRPVEVDHCGACRLLWFDTLESVNLSGLGWTRALRELQHGAGQAPPPRPEALPCPLCRSPLKPVHNATRYGRFPALECPQRHGHLHGHAGMLAERGLVRPLLPPERQALAQEKRALHCLNCGAPADGGGDTCRWCQTPLLVLDLPRLAHALRQRSGQWSDSPRPDAATPMRWACHGCGAALDPSRDVACAACGHAVVAPALTDLGPLLDAAEHHWRSAEMAARPYRKKPARPPHWQETGLGLLHRFWRVGGDGPRGPTPPLQWAAWAVAAVLLLWLVLARR